MHRITKPVMVWKPRECRSVHGDTWSPEGAAGKGFKEWSGYWKVADLALQAGTATVDIAVLAQLRLDPGQAPPALCLALHTSPGWVGT